MPSRTDRDIGAPLKWMHLHVHTHGSGWAWRVSMHVHLLPVLPQISIAYDAFFDDGEHTQILQNSLLSQFRAIDHSWGVKGSQVREPNAAATSMRTPFGWGPPRGLQGSVSWVGAADLRGQRRRMLDHDRAETVPAVAQRVGLPEERH
jgi:hypothetical protein